MPRSQTRPVEDPFAKRPWHVAGLLWSLLPHALLPISLATIHQFLERFVAHLLRPNIRVRPRQVDCFRQQILEMFG